jgi:UDP-N-acetylglucosamine:LPS N-acetylglucosamine transferase
MRLRPAFDGCEMLFVSTNPGYAAQVAPARFRSVPDANRWQKMRVLWMFINVAWIVARFRPSVVVTTGAAPGYAAIRFAKLLRARTLWIDSIANAEELSMAGRMAGRHSDEWLTQWEHLSGLPQHSLRGASTERTPRFEGAVL